MHDLLPNVQFKKGEKTHGVSSRLVQMVANCVKHQKYIKNYWNFTIKILERYPWWFFLCPYCRCSCVIVDSEKAFTDWKTHLRFTKLKMKIQRKNKSQSFSFFILSLSRFLATENPFKMMKNTLNLTLKALFVYKIFKFLFWVFGHVEKRLD